MAGSWLDLVLPADRRALLGAIGAASISIAACSDSTSEPPPAPRAVDSVAVTSASTIASVAPPPTLPSSSSEAVTLPATVKGVLPAGFADKVIPENAPVRVALLGAGAEPRAQYAFVFKEGDVAATEMRMHIEVTRPDAPDDSSPPDMKFTVQLTVGAPDKDRVRLSGKLVDVAFGAPPKNMKPELVDHWVSDLKQLSFDLFVDHEGREQEFRVNVPSNMPPGADQLINSMRGALTEAIVPLPSEAIGLGATWQSVSRVGADGGIVAFRTYQLMAAKEGVLDIDTRTDLYMAKSELVGPAHKASQVEEFKSSQTGAVTISVAEIAPRVGHQDMTSEVNLHLSTPSGNSTSFKTSSKIHFELARAGTASKAPPK